MTISKALQQLIEDKGKLDYPLILTAGGIFKWVGYVGQGQHEARRVNAFDAGYILALLDSGKLAVTDKVLEGGKRIIPYGPCR